MEIRNYPYFASFSYGSEGKIVVLFNGKNEGIVIKNNVECINDMYQVGFSYQFKEKLFLPLKRKNFTIKI